MTAPSPRAQLDALLDAARKDKQSYAEVELANGAKLTIGAIFIYHLRFSCTSGETDIKDINYSAAFDLLNASADSPEHLAKTIAELREGRVVEAPVALAPRRRPSKEGQAFAKTLEVDPLRRSY